MKSLETLFKNTVVIIFTLASSVLFAQKPANNTAFNKLLNDYYEEGLLFDPLAATQRGDNRYNDLLPNDISAPYLKKVHSYNIKYQKLLAGFKKESFNSFDKISFVNKIYYQP